MRVRLRQTVRVPAPVRVAVALRTQQVEAVSSGMRVTRVRLGPERALVQAPRVRELERAQAPTAAWAVARPAAGLRAPAPWAAARTGPWCWTGRLATLELLG